MVTAKQLLANSIAKADVEIDNINSVRYDLAQKKLHFNVMVKGSNNNAYKVEIAFYDIDPGDLTSEDLAKGMIPRAIKDLDNKPIKVDCDCTSYTLGGCLKGNLKSGCALYTDKVLTNYKKKTDREEKNPENKPMACKHIIGVLKAILETYGM